MDIWEPTPDGKKELTSDYNVKFNFLTMRYLLLVVIVVCSCSQVSNQPENVTVHESSLDSVLPVTDSSIIEETSIKCLEIMRNIDKEKLTSMCAENSISGFDSILDDGRKLGFYILLFRNSLGTI